MIKEIIDRNFKTIVEEYDGGYKVNFIGVASQRGHLSFVKAKTGWKNKPISQNMYIVNDGEMYQILDTLEMYMSLEKEELNEVKKHFTNIGIEKLMEWLEQQE
jgi:hypothetical protein